jgi:hypothetical protein
LNCEQARQSNIPCESIYINRTRGLMSDVKQEPRNEFQASNKLRKKQKLKIKKSSQDRFALLIFNF